MKKILPILLLFVAGCSSLNETVISANDHVSCRIECRQLNKKVDESKSSCACMESESVKSPELIQIESLSKQISSLKQRVEELTPVAPALTVVTETQPVQSMNILPAKSSPLKMNSKEEKDPLRDLLKE
jgi:hypothetical protein